MLSLQATRTLETEQLENQLTPSEVENRGTERLSNTYICTIEGHLGKKRRRNRPLCLAYDLGPRLCRLIALGTFDIDVLFT